MTKDKVRSTKEALKLALEYVELVPDDRYNAEHIDREALVTAIKEALMSVPDGAQPEQPKVRTGNCLRVGVCASEGHKIAPQRKTLTEEEIFSCENSVPDETVTDRDWCIYFARAIEATHGIIAPTELKGEA